MKNLVLSICICLSTSLYAQKTIEGYELGLDGFVSASTIGGTFGIGPKFGLRFNDNLILGPSFRFQRSWSNNISTKYGYNIFGGGMFLHGRYANILFGGFEFEMLKSPISYTVVNSSKNWIPTLFICGGFSKEFNEIIRLNVGIYYDVINHVNSPFRQGYFLTVKNQSGQIVKYVPMIYRISFYFPLGKKDKKTEAEEEIEELEETEEF